MSHTLIVFVLIQNAFRNNLNIYIPNNTDTVYSKSVFRSQDIVNISLYNPVR